MCSYETGNNIIAEESGYIKTIGEGEDRAEAIVQQGTFSYTSPEGQLITIHYTADETGFHASGDHIPTPPPVSEEIQKGLDLIYAGIRQQEVRIYPWPLLSSVRISNRRSEYDGNCDTTLLPVMLLLLYYETTLFDLFPFIKIVILFFVKYIFSDFFLF